MRISYGALALVSSLALSACVTNSPDQPSGDVALTGGEWLVEDIANRGVMGMAQTTLTFGQDGRLNGNTACNGYFADYRIYGNNLMIGSAGATERACPPAVMEQESRFLGVLNDVDTYRIDETGALILLTPSGTTITARQRMGTQTVYRCTDGSIVTASYPTPETARVTYDDRTVDMRIAVSGSGARDVGDSLQWWTKGRDEGMIAPLAPGDTMASAAGMTCMAS